MESIKMCNKICMLHVPKTAGTSIRKAITEEWLAKLIITHCDHGTALENLFLSCTNLSPDAVFLVLRDPVKWYKSFYDFKMNSNLNCPVKDYPRMEHNTWNDFFDDCIMLENGVAGLKKWFKPWEEYHERITKFLMQEEGIFSSFYRFYSSFHITLNENFFIKQSQFYSLEILRMECIEDDLNLAVKKVSRVCPYIKLGRENRSTENPLGYAKMTPKQEQIINDKDRKIYNILLNLRKS